MKYTEHERSKGTFRKLNDSAVRFYKAHTKQGSIYEEKKKKNASFVIQGLKECIKGSEPSVSPELYPN